MPNNHGIGKNMTVWYTDKMDDLLSEFVPVNWSRRDKILWPIKQRKEQSHTRTNIPGNLGLIEILESFLTIYDARTICV